MDGVEENRKEREVSLSKNIVSGKGIMGQMKRKMEKRVHLENNGGVNKYPFKSNETEIGCWQSLSLLKLTSCPCMT